MTIREAKEAGYTRDDVKVLSKEESAKAAAAEADKKK